MPWLFTSPGHQYICHWSLLFPVTWLRSMTFTSKKDNNLLEICWLLKHALVILYELDDIVLLLVIPFWIRLIMMKIMLSPLLGVISLTVEYNFKQLTFHLGWKLLALIRERWKPSKCVKDPHLLNQLAALVIVLQRQMSYGIIWVMV